MASRVVLVADDDPAIRRLLRRILSHEFVVVEAGDGEEAVKAAVAEHPDVVLLDLNMPGLDGHEALLRLRAEPGLRTTPVLVVTGSAVGGEEAAACLRDGAHDFVRKPFDDFELVARVRAAYRHKAFEDELRRRNRELELFASQAAHDLKSPLAGIMIISDVLTRGLPKDEETKRGLQDEIGGLAERGARLVTELLELARQDWAGGIAVAAGLLDPEQVVVSVLEAARLDDADVEFDGQWGDVAMPEAELRSVLANLVDNASHYGRDEKGHLDLSITAGIRPGQLVITVEDRGDGVPETVADHIFEPFVTAPGSQERNPSSTGLGLALVKRTVERHGGTIELEGHRPVGTAVCVTLPLAEPST